jgi:hypothetical protein
MSVPAQSLPRDTPNIMLSTEVGTVNISKESLAPHQFSKEHSIITLFFIAPVRPRTLTTKSWQIMKLVLTMRTKCKNAQD